MALWEKEGAILWMASVLHPFERLSSSGDDKSVDYDAGNDM